MTRGSDVELWLWKLFRLLPPVWELLFWESLSELVLAVSIWLLSVTLTTTGTKVSTVGEQWIFRRKERGKVRRRVLSVAYASPLVLFSLFSYASVLFSSESLVSPLRSLLFSSRSLRTALALLRWFQQSADLIERVIGRAAKVGVVGNHLGIFHEASAMGCLMNGIS